MRIVGTGLGKKYETRWIFRDVSIDLAVGDSLAIKGSNGSGKSTLLQILAGSLTPSAGEIEYYQGEDRIENESVPTLFNFSAPYIELIEEFTLSEHLGFHSKFHQPILPVAEMMERMGYPESIHQPVREFSSGMKQRLRLALAFFYESSAVCLDEPTSNLDESGIAWYQSEMKTLLGKRTILIASNQRYEYDFCQKTIRLNPQ